MAYKLNYKTGTVAHSPNLNIYFSNISFSNHNNFVQDFFTVKSCVTFSEQIYVRVRRESTLCTSEKVQRLFRRDKCVVVCNVK